ncbi:snoRNA-binding rRNA-processing protein [Nowakowskiella sp. JEL0078]|nr:snoRNA-binding rRNA-processing protein [Nowakowskiella sp. JEL0078]
MVHGTPVENLIELPGGSLIASAGGNQIKIWDILGGGRIISNIINGQKTVTSMCLDGSGTRLLSGSLDRLVKVYSVGDFKHLYTLKYTEPILSVGLSPDDSKLVVGMTTGLLSIRQKTLKTADMIESVQKDVASIRGKPSEYFLRGASHKAEEDDVTVKISRTKKLSNYDKHLKKFEYSKALDAVLGKNSAKKSPLIVIALIEELIHRDGLRIALGGRDDLSLEPLARFLVLHINNPRYSKLLVNVANLVLDMYWDVIGKSTIIDELFSKMRSNVDLELKAQKSLVEVLGMLETLFATSVQ